MFVLAFAHTSAQHTPHTTQYTQYTQHTAQRYVCVSSSHLNQVCVLLCGPPVPLRWGRGGEREEEEEGEEGEEEDHNVCVSNRTQHTHTARRAQSTQL